MAGILGGSNVPQNWLSRKKGEHQTLQNLEQKLRHWGEKGYGVTSPQSSKTKNLQDNQKLGSSGI